MKAETLRAEVVTALQEHAWDQWSQLGISGATPTHREERAADPEALLLFTLEIGRTDPRLFDEVLDWLALNEPLMSVHRLRNLCANSTDRALVDAALDWTAGARHRKQPSASAKQSGNPAELQTLFPGIPKPTPAFDPAFARHGLARAPAMRSGKSQPPRLQAPINFAFRLRRLLGVGVRAEVVRALLTIRAPRLPAKIIGASAGFAQRNVREGLTQLHEAGVVDVASVADERYYSIESNDWATLLRLQAAPNLPLHYDWIPAYRALTAIARRLQQPGIDDLTPFLRASQARTLTDEVGPDLQLAGVPVQIYAAHGAEFWEAFVEITRAAIREARGSSRTTADR
jgi:hypothetical protein